MKHNKTTTNDYQLTTIQRVYLEDGSIMFRAETQTERDQIEKQEQDYQDKWTAKNDHYYPIY
jgi:hypothetical protein